MSSATFSRSSTAYNPETGEMVDANEPRFVAGPFAGRKAVLVEEGTTKTNLVSLDKQKFVGWIAYQGASVTLTQDQVVPEWGATDATRIQTTGGSHILKYYYYVGALTGPYSLQLRVKNQGTATVEIHSNQGGKNQYVAPGQSVHVKLENIVGDGVGNIQIQLRTLSVEGNLDLIAWRPMAEAKPYATSFHDGTRSPESPTIPTAGVLNDRGPWTVECWAKTNYSGSGHRMPFAAWNKFYVDLNPSDKPQFSWVDANNVQQFAIATNALNNPTGWHYWAFTWDGVTARIYVDGVKVIEVETDLPKPLPAYLTVGWGAGGYYWNGLIADLRISSRARSDEEILAAYQSGAPLQADADTTYLLPLNGDLLNLANQGGSVTRLSVRGIGAGSKEARQGSPSIARASISSQGSGLAIKQGGRITRVSLTTISGHGLPIKQGGSLSSLLLLSSGQGMRFRATRGRTEILTGEGNIVNVADSKREVILI